MFLALRAYASCERDPNHIGNTASDGSRAAPGAKPHVRESDAIRPKVNALRRKVYGDLMGSFREGCAGRCSRWRLDDRCRPRRSDFGAIDGIAPSFGDAGARRRAMVSAISRAPRQPMERFDADRPPR